MNSLSAAALSTLEQKAPSGEEALNGETAQFLFQFVECTAAAAAAASAFHIHHLETA